MCRLIFEETHSIMSKSKSVRDVVRVPAELIKDVGEAILSISKRESDEQIAALKSEQSKKTRNRKVMAVAGAGSSSQRLGRSLHDSSGVWRLP